MFMKCSLPVKSTQNFDAYCKILSFPSYIESISVLNDDKFLFFVGLFDILYKKKNKRKD